MEDLKEKALTKHLSLKGKIATALKDEITSADDLALLYSPGVAYPCLAIKEAPDKVYDYTFKGNTILVVTDGSAVLGLGNIGAHAALPVMEGKCLLFKQFADINAFPLCLDTQDEEEIIKICQMVAPTVGGINLEDISAPRCINIENTLKKTLDIPVFHDDQHGTSIVVAAALLNLVRLHHLDISLMKVVVSGTGAAGHSIIRLIHQLGVSDIYAYNKNGVVSYHNEPDSITKKLLDEQILKEPNITQNTLSDLLLNADLFIGVSAGDLLKADDIVKMRHRFVFALANPRPELSFEEAQKANVTVYATGRSDYPNQINNILAFPGLFKGTLKARASKISNEMILAATYSLSQIILDDELNNSYIIPSPFDKRVVERVSDAVSKQAIREMEGV